MYANQHKPDFLQLRDPAHVYGNVQTLNAAHRTILAWVCALSAF
jgi:hypothetical protein